MEMDITDKEIQAFWNRFETNLKKEKELAVLAYIFLPIAIIFRESIRRKYYEGNASALITNLWYMLKDYKADNIPGKIDYAWLDHGEESWRKRFKLLWFIPFPLNESKYAAYMWMLRNNIWNRKRSTAEIENGVYKNALFLISKLKKGNDKLLRKISNWAELMYVEKEDATPANRGSIFSFEHTIRGEQEVYYRTFNGLVHGRYSKVYTLMKLPFGYQLAREVQKGTGGKNSRYRKKTKLIKHKDNL